MSGLVGLGELPEGGKGVRTKLGEDTGDKFGEFLGLTTAVDAESVGTGGMVD